MIAVQAPSAGIVGVTGVLTVRLHRHTDIVMAQRRDGFHIAGLAIIADIVHRAGSGTGRFRGRTHVAMAIGRDLLCVAVTAFARIGPDSHGGAGGLQRNVRAIAMFMGHTQLALITLQRHSAAMGICNTVPGITPVENIPTLQILALEGGQRIAVTVSIPYAVTQVVHRACGGFCHLNSRNIAAGIIGNIRNQHHMDTRLAQAVAHFHPFVGRIADFRCEIADGCRCLTAAQSPGP